MTSDIPDWVKSFQEAECEFCRNKIYWVTHIKGYKIPMDSDWRPHRLSCTYAEKWTKKNKEQKMRQTTLDEFGRVGDKYDNK